MAPLEHIEVRHGSLVQPREGNGKPDRGRLRRKGNGQGDGNKRDGGGYNGGGNGNVNGNNVDGNSNNRSNNNGDGGRKSNADSFPDFFPTTLLGPIPTAAMSVVSAPPMTIVVTSTNIATPISSSASSLSSLAWSSTFTSSSASSSPLASSVSFTIIPVSPTSTTPLRLFPTTVSSVMPTVTVYASFPDPSSPPRKGLDGDNDPPPTTTISSTQTFSTLSSTTLSGSIIAESALSVPTSISIPDTADYNNQPYYPKNQNKNNSQLSPMAQHLLIAAGAIGAFIIVTAAIWFFAKMRKIDLFASLRNYKVERGGSRGWYGWRRQREDYYTDPPPQYSGAYPPDEKPFITPKQQPMETFYTPANVPPMATPAASAAAPIRVNSQHQEMIREALQDDSASFGVLPALRQVVSPIQQGPALQKFYNPGDQNSSLSRQGTQTTQASAAHSGYDNAGTQQTFQTSGAYDPDQREVNHLSYLSSLSSGFGDGLIMPEPTVVGAGDSRQSYRNTRKFSWMTAQGRASGPMGDRDTIYTRSSIETAPRFRTIHSWVAQQSGRVGRQEQSDKEVPSMPPIPLPLQNGSGTLHQRNQSEDPAFRHHPGDEIVNFGRGSRVPSSILDRKVNVNLG